MSNLTLGFIGLGLIGGSVAKALKNAYPDCKIVVYDINVATGKSAVDDGVASIYTTEINDSFSACDFIFMCAPVEDNNENLLKLGAIIKETCIITDVGSVKTPILTTIEKLGLAKQFIGGHPMAGSERFGYANSKPGILENAYYILTPTELVPTVRISELQTLVQNMGAIPLVLSASMHDYVTGAISHLPHVISAALVNLVHDEDSKEGLMKMIAAGGFKDITRISSSSPDMWQQICLTNKDNIVALLEKYIDSLYSIKDKIDTSSAAELYNFFNDARLYRDSFIANNSGPIKAEYVITVDIADKPGAIAEIATLLSQHDVNIKNIGINHNREFAEGALRIQFYNENSTNKAIAVMNDNGYSIHSKGNL